MPGSEKRIAKNTLMLYVRMAVVMIVNLYVVRVVLKGLGVVDFGVYNAVAGIVTMLDCVASVLSTSLQRFYSFSLGNDEGEDRMRDIFSSGMMIYLVFCLVVFLLAETLGLWLVNAKLVIPPGRLAAANWVYQFSVLAFVFKLLQIPYYSATIAHEDMQYFAAISLGECFAKLVFALFIAKVPFDALVYYGAYLAVVPLVSLILYAVIGRRKYWECRYRKVEDRGLYKDILSFSGWTLVGSVAGVGMNQVNTILVNVFFGPVATAARAISLQIDSAISSLCASFLMAVRPPVTKAHAAGDPAGVMRLFKASSDFVFYILVAVCVPLVVEMDKIIDFWLTDYTSDTVLFSRIIVVYSVVMMIGNPITIVMQAVGKVKEYFVPVEVFTLLCPVVVYVLFKCGFPSYTLFLVMIAAAVLSHIVRVVCMARYAEGFSVGAYLFRFILPAFLFGAALSAAAVLYHFTLASGLLSVLVEFAASVAVTGVFVWFAVLGKDGRKIVIDFISSGRKA